MIGLGSDAPSVTFFICIFCCDLQDSLRRPKPYAVLYHLLIPVHTNSPTPSRSWAGICEMGTMAVVLLWLFIFSLVHRCSPPHHKLWTLKHSTVAQ